ncbi:MAG: PBP1A family penicillin-binding protein [Candidatus Firestonebacteria bacterium]
MKNKKFKFRIIILGCILLGWFIGLIITYYRELPTLSELEGYKPSLASKIYDINENLIAQLYIEQRTLVPLYKVPKYLQNAIIVVEDENFYKHWGIDISGIIRAFLVNVIHGRVEQGGSTITQQLARNLFLTQERTISRKIKEAMLALKIEYKYTKKEILQMYLNQVYFGGGAYGIETAGRIYFGKHVEELTLPECATLAGLPRAPNEYSPYKNIERAKKRRNKIIDRLVKKKFITKEEGDIAKETSIELHKLESKNAPYFVEYIRQQLEEIYGNNIVYKGGLSIYTTLDLTLQDIAQRVTAKGLEDAEIKIAKELGIPIENIYDSEFKKNIPVQIALIAIEPKTGYIKAMIGGRDFSESEFNRAIQAKRQPGSAFKPFIYTAAIDNGFTPADIIIDSPLVITDNDGTIWKPENYEKKFFGPTTLRKAITNSRNVVTLKLLTKIGISAVHSYAHKMGIKSNISRNLSLAFGTSEVTLLELTSAFATFPNIGIEIEPISIASIKDSSGKVIQENDPRLQEVLKPETVYIMTSLLNSVVNEGTGQSIRRLGFKYDCAGKTGTTDNQSDVWFIGFTSDLVVGIWLGFDDRRSLGNTITSSNTSASIWGEFMLEVYNEKQPANFSKPDNIVTVKIDPETGLLAGNKCKKVIDEIFIKGTEPTKICNKHDDFNMFELRPTTR